MKEAKRIALSILVGCIMTAIALSVSLPDKKDKPLKVLARPSDKAGVVHKALIKAARAAGVDPVLVLAIASIESNFNPKAKARTSSARGLGQFINQTGRRYGLKNNGRDSVAAQARALARFTADNFNALTQFKDKEPSPGELYLAHFAGLEGVKRMAGLTDNKPIRRALSGKAIKANRRILKGKTIGQVRAWADRKMARKMAFVQKYLGYNIAENQPSLWVNRSE